MTPACLRRRVYVYRSNGTPFPFTSPITAGSAPLGGPVIGDVTGDGVPEIIVSLPGTQGLAAIRPDGTLLPGWPKAGRMGGIVLGDLDGDDVPEIVLPGIAYKGNGSTLPGWQH